MIQKRGWRVAFTWIWQQRHNNNDNSNNNSLTHSTGVSWTELLAEVDICALWLRIALSRGNPHLVISMNFILFFLKFFQLYVYYSYLQQFLGTSAEPPTRAFGLELRYLWMVMVIIIVITKWNNNSVMLLYLRSKVMDLNWMQVRATLRCYAFEFSSVKI